MTTWRLMMLSGPLFAPATVPLVALASVISVDMNQKEDGTHELVVSAPAGAAWLEFVQAKRVIWVWVDGEVTEWLIARKTDALGESGVTVHCDPLHRILVDLGTVEHVSAPGARPTSNLRGQNGNAENYLTTFVEQQLVRRGLDSWIGIGDVDFPNERFDLSFDNVTMWGVVIAVKERVMGKARLRRDTYDRVYLIDVVESFTIAGVPEFWVVEGRNLLQLVREFSDTNMRTALRPVGELAPGESERASIVFATHVVLGKSGNTLTLGRHGHEDDATVGPIVQDGQFAPILVNGDVVYAGKYLEAMDGTRHPVASTTSPQTVVLGSGGASFAVGDDVFFVDDEDGTGLTELAFPDGIQESGFVQGKTEQPFHGHRNYVRNPGFRFWGTPAPDVDAGNVDGAHAGVTSFLLKNLTPGKVVAAGDVLQIGTVSTDRITAGGTVPGGGGLTVTIGTARSASDNDPVNVHLQADRGPTYYTRLPADIGHLAPKRVARVGGTTYAAEADGAHTSASTVLNIRNLTPGDVIVPGSVIGAGGSGRTYAVTHAVADGAGDAQVVMLTPLTLSDGQALTIHLPPIGESDGYAVGHWTAFGTVVGGAGILSQDVFVRYWPGLHLDEDGNEINRLWALADMVALASTPGVGGGWHESTAGEPRPPRLMVTDSGGTELVGAHPANWSPGAEGEARTEVLRVSHDITADFTGKVRLRWPYVVAPASPAVGPWVDCRFLQLHLGMDGNAAFVEGAAASSLFYASNVLGQLYSQWAGTIRITNVELGAALGIPHDSPALGLGRVIRLRSETKGIINAIWAVTGMRMTRESEARILTLGSAPEHFTDQVLSSRRKKQYADVDVTVTTPAVGEALQVKQTVLTSDDPPLKTGMGFRVPPGSTATGAQTVELIE